MSRCLPFRRLALVCAVAASLLGDAAHAQTADTVRVTVPSQTNRPVTTVPLPNGRGVFYYRAGTPGGVRIRSRNGTRSDTMSAPPAPTAGATPVASPAAPSVTAMAPPASVGAPADGLTRLDLLELERNLIESFGRRLAALERELDRTRDTQFQAPQQAPAPVIVLPGQPASPATTPLAPAPRVDAPPRTPSDPPVVGPAVPRPAPGPVTVETVERAILDTGLFRTTTVNFEFAKAALLPTASMTLDILADVLRRYPALRVEVGGHTDDRGSNATNDALSQRRAQSVLDYLVASGVTSDRLTAVGYGERRPVADNGNDTGRALNRRVEFVVLNPEAAERPRR